MHHCFPERQDNLLRIFILGDSTAMTYAQTDAPKAGWGQFFKELFAPGTEVFNHAIGGRSTKSFIAEGRLLQAEALLRPGDCVMIQFGHNDNASSLVWRRTYAESSYTNNLLLMACAAQQRGACPVLITPIAQRVFTPQGDVEDTFADYAQAVRRLARAENIPLLDHRRETMGLLKALGPEKSKGLYIHLPAGVWPAWPDGLTDNTHTRVEGARAFAGLLARCIRESTLPLRSLLKEGTA